MRENSEGNIKNAFKAGIWYTISTLMVRAIGIVSTPIFTRMLTIDEYGVTATFTTWYTLLFIICSLNVGYSIGRAKIDYKNDFDNYINSLQVLVSIVTICVFIPVFILIDPISTFSGLDRYSIICLFVYLLFGTTLSVNQGRYRYKYLYKQNIIISFIVSLGSVTCSYFLMLTLENKLAGRILGIALPTIVLGLYFWIIRIKNKELTINIDYFKYAIAFSTPLIVHSIALYVLGQSDRLMIRYFCGNASTGIYSLVYQYGIVISMITNSINQAWNPWFHDNYAAGRQDLIEKNVKPLIVLGCFICIGCVGIAPEAILVLGGKKYLEGLAVVLPVSLGVVIEYVYTQYVIIEMHLKKTKFVSLGTVIAAALNFVLNAIFIPKYGYVAAAYTTLASYFVLFFIHYFITRYLLKVHIYKDWFMYIAIGITGIIGFYLSSLYDLIIARYAALAVITIILALVFKDKIISFIKSKRNKNNTYQE